MSMFYRNGRKERLGLFRRLSKRVREPRFISAMTLLFILAVCVALLALIPLDRTDEIVGRKVMKNISAEADCQIIDAAMTEEARAAARTATPLCYKQDQNERDNSLRNLDNFYDEIRERIKAEADKSMYTGVERGLVGRIVTAMPQSAMQAFQKAEASQRLAEYINFWKSIITLGILSDTEVVPPKKQILVFSENWTRLNPEDQILQYRLGTIIKRMSNDICSELPGDLSNNDKLHKYIEDVFSELVSKNLTFDEAMTKKRRDAALKEVVVKRSIRKGQLLFTKGTILTDEQKEFYRKYREEVKPTNENLHRSLTISARILVVLFLLFFICIYIYHIHPEVTHNNGSIWKLGSFTVLCLVIDRLAIGAFFHIAQACDFPQVIFFLALPLALPSLLISVTYGLRSAIYIGLFTSGIVACALDFSFPAFLTGILVCGFAGYAVRYTTDYKKFFFRAFLVCFITTFVSGIVFTGEKVFDTYTQSATFPQSQSADSNENLAEPLKEDVPPGNFFGIQMIPQDVAPIAYDITSVLFVIPFGSGLFTAFCAMMLLFMCETNMSYLAFTDRNHELLKRLAAEASGSFQHSVRVADLAVAAADAIGLQPTIRIQACALFHDIGKLKYPGMFTENTGGTKPLEGMMPLESVKILRAHVEYGIELAKKHKLLPLIEEAIQCHHGTTHVSYFYDALKKDGVPDLNEAEYSYNGPKPQKREIALLMLADSCEAAVSSNRDKNLSMEQITELVSNILLDKIRKGQLNQVNLTTKEINIIRSAFLDVFSKDDGKHRTEYPDLDKKEINVS